MVDPGPRGRLPGDLAANPRLSTWVDLDLPGVVTVRIGKVELGQGIVTAVAQIAAEELDVALGRVRMVTATTAAGPDEACTSGSRSVQDCGLAVRQVCAEVRAVLLERAAAALGRTAPALRVVDGCVTDDHGGGQVSYWELAGPGLLDRDADGVAVPKPARHHTVVGTSVPRLDLGDKVAGRPRFVHDLRPPGLLYGRVVRPPSPGARLLALDPPAGGPGVVAVVADGRFLGVVADREEAAVAAADRLAAAARWEEEDTLPDEAALDAWLRDQPAETTVVEDRAGPPPAGAGGAVRHLRATYSRPFVAHASMAPSCGVAVWRGGGVEVWSSTQSVHGLRRAVGLALGLPVEGIAVHHVEGAGCYGHNGADDAAFDAVLLARAVPRRPVQVVWTRADELAWAPFGPAMIVDLAAGLAADGTIVSWEHDVWSQGHTSRPGFDGSPALLGAAHVAGGDDVPPAADPPHRGGGGTTRNAVPLYDLPSCRVRGHRALTAPLRTSAMRSLGAAGNVFAIECFLDELAAAAGADPVAYRLRHLSDPRARAVVEAAASAAGWDGRARGEATGHGIGFARYKNSAAYCAVVAEVEAVHDVRVTRLVVAVDVGQVVNPDGVANQIEGGAVQATSWALREVVRFDRRRVTSTDWESYPILRFSEVPAVTVEVLDRPDEPPLGAGEAAQGPTLAAIGNALRDALGVPVRSLPFTPDRVVAAITGGAPS